MGSIPTGGSIIKVGCTDIIKMTQTNRIVEELRRALPDGKVLSDSEISEDYSHDEAYATVPQMPAAVVLPNATDDVVVVVDTAARIGVSVTPRGSGTGLAGGCIPAPGGVVISFQNMRSILEIDTANNVAVVEPGVTLRELDEEAAKYGLAYPIVIGEKSASIGGMVATNAGGMQAVKYGVTRNHVLGLEVVLSSGKVIHTGGKLFKLSSGYDLTQLFVGSEGTLGVVTEITVRLVPRMEYRTTLLVPFTDLVDATAAVPKITSSGIGPLILEYIDALTMDAITRDVGLELGIDESIKSKCSAYLVVVLEDRVESSAEKGMEDVTAIVTANGAEEVYVLPSPVAMRLLEARDRAHWMAKANGANDIVDVVVPRAAMADFMQSVSEISQKMNSLVVGCGHAGDGNVHLSVFQPDPDVRHSVVLSILRSGVQFGGGVSAEHGIGKAKRSDFIELEDAAKLDVMRKIKSALDPAGLFSPGNVL